MDDLRDAIRLDHVAIGFVEAPAKTRWLPGFLTRSPRPDPARDLDELDDIFIWYLRRGYELHRSLHRLGLGPEPEWLPADGEEDVYQDEIGHPCYDSTRTLKQAADGVNALPATFAALITAWLQAKPGRTLRLKIGSVESEAATVLAAERLLRAARGPWKTGSAP